MDIRPTGAPVKPPTVTERAPASETSSVAKAAPAEPAEQAIKAAPPSAAEVAQAVRNINKAMGNMSLGLEFSVDNDDHRTIIKVVDQETKEVIRQFPSEEALQIAKTLDQVQGLLIKQKA